MVKNYQTRSREHSSIDMNNIFLYVMIRVQTLDIPLIYCKENDKQCSLGIG